MKLKEVTAVTGEFFENNVAFIWKIVSDLGIEDESHVLDVGTGHGTMAIVLAAHGFKVTTGEPKDDKWADWKTPARELGLLDRINFTPFMAENLPFPDRYFDAVFLYGALHHIEDKKGAIEEMCRVLKADGHLCLIELNEKAIRELKGRMRHHPDMVDPRDYTDQLQVDFEIKKHATATAYLGRKCKQ